MLGLCALGYRRPPSAVLPIGIGAVLPDAPMLVFYGVQKLVLGTPERIIWASRYFEPIWQDFFDLFNSLPLIGLGLLVAAVARRQAWVLLFASMSLHVLLDLPLHHDDAHRHFYPLSNWRFESPVSYWNPDHYGRLTAPLEAALGLLGCGVLARRHRSARARAAIALLMLVYVAYIGFALFMWV